MFSLRSEVLVATPVLRVSDSPSPLAALQTRLIYTFRDPALLERAVTHTSYLPENPDIAESNQRLEFLGDAVLQLILTEALFELFPGDREGPLSRRRAALTKGAFLVELARELQLDRCLLLGSSEEASGGRTRSSALEDAFEALVGALYLDSDLALTRRIVLGLYGDLPSRLSGVVNEENPKGRLQELIQPEYGNQALRYEVTGIEGEDHARAYEVAVFLHDRVLGSGRGPSKKLAEEAAARVALETLKAQ
ncbi:Ribonuclease III [Opitutus terrae PB90-1]|uniref:Ribonuclease 3 n=1 Tax=Opitutus terrae (strain DSM 11246 / JCM 15787 / PB90-1) TaxID=452637 RepID=B1ZYU8_OPITP|nr:Ribonuclease III [Opitutus terrae PB90-1]